jgi:hypothetical protein
MAMRKKNPLTTIFHSNSPNRLKGYEYFYNTPLAELYNYGPIIHDAWVFLAAIQKQMIMIYGNKEDLPKDFKNLFTVDLQIMIDYLKQWMPRKIHDCTCERAMFVNKPSCGKCLEGKTGGRLKEYVESYTDTD